MILRSFCPRHWNSRRAIIRDKKDWEEEVWRRVGNSALDRLGVRR